MRLAKGPAPRPAAPAPEALPFQAMPMPDRGFIGVLGETGDDPAIVQADRASHGRGTRAAR